MGIVDFFRPRHRHSNAEVRAEAVRQLTPDDTALLRSIARDDSETNIRKLAIDKLDDAEALLEIASAQQDRALRDLALARAAALWTSAAVQAADFNAARPSIEGLRRAEQQRALVEVAVRAERADVRDAAIDALDDQKALAELAKSSPVPQVRSHALDRISDPEILRAIAVDTTNKDLATAVVDRIEDEEALEQIASKAKNKAARARARKSLQAKAKPVVATSSVSDQDKRARAERLQILRTIEALAGGHEWVESFEELEACSKAWAAVEGKTDENLEERFREARGRYLVRREKYGQEQLKLAEAQAKREADEARAEAAAAARAAAEAAGETSAPADEDGETATAEAAADDASNEAAAADDAERAAGREARRLAAEAKAADKAKREQERAEAQEQTVARLEALIADLVSLATTDDIPPAERALQQAQKAFADARLPAEIKRGLSDRYDAARQALFIRIGELREAKDWERWANVPRLEALVRDAEALVEAELEGLGNKLKELQAAWKQVGSAPRERHNELWAKFKETCDRVYDRVKVQRDEAAVGHAENLALKEALCVEAERLSTSTDWEATAAAIKALQTEWKTIGVAGNRKVSDAVWKRFRTACDAFFERRKPHLDAVFQAQEDNLAKKRGLIAKAEKLAESADWAETARALKGLQREWKEIGHVPRKDANEIWTAFRTVCDGFFSRRDNELAEQRAAEQRELDQLNAEIDAIVADTSLEPAAVVERTLAVRKTVREFEERDIEPSKELAGKLESFYPTVLERATDAFAGTELDVAVSKQRREKLIARAEELAPKQETAPSGDESNLADRLKAAMAKNAFSAAMANRAADGRPIADVVAELRGAWGKLGPVPGLDGSALETSFAAACTLALSLADNSADDDYEDRPARRPRRERDQDGGGRRGGGRGQEAAKPAVVEAAKPAVVEAAKPAVVEAVKPAVVEAAKPAVVEAAKPAVVEAVKPAVVEAAKPAVAPATDEAASAVELDAVTPEAVDEGWD